MNYWLAAGRYAMQRSANVEATAHLNNGLDTLKELPNSSQTNLHELALQTTLGLAVMMSKGYAAPEVEKAYVPFKQAFVLDQDIRSGMMLLTCLDVLDYSNELKSFANQILRLAQRRISAP